MIAERADLLLSVSWICLLLKVGWLRLREIISAILFNQSADLESSYDLSLATLFLRLYQSSPTYMTAKQRPFVHETFAVICPYFEPAGDSHMSILPPNYSESLLTLLMTYKICPIAVLRMVQGLTRGFVP